jgi:hypothetical protein
MITCTVSSYPLCKHMVLPASWCGVGPPVWYDQDIHVSTGRELRGSASDEAKPCEIHASYVSDLNWWQFVACIKRNVMEELAPKSSPFQGHRNVLSVPVPGFARGLRRKAEALGS